MLMDKWILHMMFIFLEVTMAHKPLKSRLSRNKTLMALGQGVRAAALSREVVLNMYHTS